MSRCYKIMLSDDNGNEVPLSTDNLSVGANGRFTIWEADYLLSDCLNETNFISRKVNQLLTFEPTHVRLCTVETRDHAIIYNDPRISKLTEIMIKSGVKDSKSAKIANCEVGKTLLNHTVNCYSEDLLINHNQRLVFRALFDIVRDESECYNLNAIFQSSEKLSKECRLDKIKTFHDYHRREYLFSELNRYNNFRDAYVFYKNFVRDYNRIEEIIGKERITAIRSALNEKKDGYNYIVSTDNRKDLVISSTRKIKYNVYQELEKKIDPVFDNDELDEEDIRIIYEKPIKHYDDNYSIPDEEEEDELKLT